MDERGAYEIRGEGITSGECAAGDGPIHEGDPFVVRHHAEHKGGIFHQRCAPTTPGWYDPTEENDGQR